MRAGDNATGEDAIRAVMGRLREFETSAGILVVEPSRAAVVAITALRSLPVEQRMGAMGMKKANHSGRYWIAVDAEPLP